MTGVISWILFLGLAILVSILVWVVRAKLGLTAYSLRETIEAFRAIPKILSYYHRERLIVSRLQKSEDLVYDRIRIQFLGVPSGDDTTRPVKLLASIEAPAREPPAGSEVWRSYLTALEHMMTEEEIPIPDLDFIRFHAE